MVPEQFLAPYLTANAIALGVLALSLGVGGALPRFVAQVLLELLS